MYLYGDVYIGLDGHISLKWSLLPPPSSVLHIHHYSLSQSNVAQQKYVVILTCEKYFKNKYELLCDMRIPHRDEELGGRTEERGGRKEEGGARKEEEEGRREEGEWRNPINIVCVVVHDK